MSSSSSPSSETEPLARLPVGVRRLLARDLIHHLLSECQSTSAIQSLAWLGSDTAAFHALLGVAGLSFTLPFDEDLPNAALGFYLDVIAGVGGTKASFAKKKKKKKKIIYSLNKM
jgi:hypothetical protein